jgi:hypothetical protein
MTSGEKKSDVAEALSGVDSAIGVGFSELAGRVAKFERATVAEMIGEVASRISHGDDAEMSLSAAVSEAGKDIRAGLEVLAAAIRELKTIEGGTF